MYKATVQITWGTGGLAARPHQYFTGHGIGWNRSIKRAIALAKEQAHRAEGSEYAPVLETVVVVDRNGQMIYANPPLPAKKTYPHAIIRTGASLGVGSGQVNATKKYGLKKKARRKAEAAASKANARLARSKLGRGGSFTVPQAKPKKKK